MGDNPKKSRLAEFALKMAAYWCILLGFIAAITLWIPGNAPLQVGLNLAGGAVSIAGIAWLIRLHRRFG